ncbi:hypothetical protein niasHS_005379 [Heterodera schachtii]|uniref:Uncharacterized protein n=1 Tax=Heterodera schachtii TaxID=97005 RepID=A0ABD2J995_HETSC
MNSSTCTNCEVLAECCKQLETELKMTKLEHQNTITKLEHQNTKLELENVKQKLKHQEQISEFQAKIAKVELISGSSIVSGAFVPPFAPPTVEHKQIQDHHSSGMQFAPLPEQNQPIGGCENAFIQQQQLTESVMNQDHLSSIPPPTPNSHQKFGSGSGGILTEKGNQIPRSTEHKRTKKTKPNVETLAKKAKENVPPPPFGPPAPAQNFLFPNPNFSLLNALAYAQMNAAVNAGTSTSGEPMPTTVLQQIPSSSTPAYYHQWANIPSASNLQQLQQEKESNGNGAGANLTDN